MDLKDEQESAPPGAAPLARQPRPTLWDRLRSEGDGSWLDAAISDTVADSCEGSTLTQLGRNLLAGCRIALFLRLDRDRLCATAGALATLAVLDLLINLTVSFLLVGRSGFFATSAIPSFFFHLPLLLLFAFWAGKILTRRSLLAVIPVALVSLSIPIELCHAVFEGLAQLERFTWLQLYLDAPHYYRFFSWWALASLLFLWRLQRTPRSRRGWTMILFILLVATPLWYFPRADLWTGAAEGAEGGELHLTEDVLSAQAGLLDRQLSKLEPGAKGVSDLYFVGFAGDASQDVFLKELTGAAQLFSDRFGASGREILLVNNPRTASTLPFATAGNLRRALARVGQLMNRNDDVLFLYLTSHGSKDHQLAVNNQPLELDALTPENVRDMLRQSGIKWKVVVVSACYSGGFIAPLKDDGTVIITAADATHESFGCGYGEKYTWFGEAFIDQALRRTLSFTKAFELARETIRQWEEKDWETPSNPQIWVGREIRPKLARLEKEMRATGD